MNFVLCFIFFQLFCKQEESSAKTAQRTGRINRFSGKVSIIIGATGTKVTRTQVEEVVNQTGYKYSYSESKIFSNKDLSETQNVAEKDIIEINLQNIFNFNSTAFLKAMKIEILTFANKTIGIGGEFFLIDDMSSERRIYYKKEKCKASYCFEYTKIKKIGIFFSFLFSHFVFLQFSFGPLLYDLFNVDYAHGKRYSTAGIFVVSLYLSLCFGLKFKNVIVFLSIDYSKKMYEKFKEIKSDKPEGDKDNVLNDLNARKSTIVNLFNKGYFSALAFLTLGLKIDLNASNSSTANYKADWLNPV